MDLYLKCITIYHNKNTNNKKMIRRKHFMKEGMLMINRITKRCSMFLEVKEMYIEITMRYQTL